MKYIKHIVLMAFVMVMTASAWGMQIYISYSAWPSTVNLTMYEGDDSRYDNMQFLALQVEPGDNIENVKAKIEDATGFSKDYQRLYFADGGRVLYDNHTLADYNIQKWSVITLQYVKPERQSDNSWRFNMPADDRMLRTIWRQDAGLAYAKSDTSVYLGFTFIGQELTNPHNLPVTYSIVPEANTITGNTINNAGVVTINGAGIDTVKAFFAGNDEYLPDTALYVIHINNPYTLTLAKTGEGTVEIELTSGGNKSTISSTISVDACCESASNEGCDNLFDGITSGNNKWGTNATQKYVEFQTAIPVQVNGYTLITANDNASATGRNPKSWVLKAKLESSDEWDTIANVTNDNTMHDVNYTPFDFNMDVPGIYQYFRFEVSAVHSGSFMQLGEMQLFYQGSPLPAGVAVKDADTGEYYVIPGTEVTVVATPAANHHLASWSNGAAVNEFDTIHVTVTKDSSITANFASQPVLTLATAGNGSVELVGNGLGISQLTIPSSWQNDESLLTVEDMPGFEPTTLQQAQAMSGIPSTGYVALIYDIDNTAVHAALFENGHIYQMSNPNTTITHKGCYQGKNNIQFYYVSSVLPDGVTVKNEENGEYYVAPGTEVIVKATPADNYHFTSWNPTRENPVDTMHITVTEDTTVTATFTVNPTLKLVADGNGSIKIGGVFQLAIPSSWKDDNTTLLTAADMPGFAPTTPEQVEAITDIPATGYVVLVYDIDNQGTPLFALFRSGSLFHVSSDNVTHKECYEGARESGTQFYYTTSDLSEYVTVKDATNGEYYVTPGTEVNIQAVPAENHYLSSWSDVEGTALTRSITVTKDSIITATFTVNPTLTLVAEGNGTVTLDGYVPAESESVLLAEFTGSLSAVNQEGKVYVLTRSDNGTTSYNPNHGLIPGINSTEISITITEGIGYAIDSVTFDLNNPSEVTRKLTQAPYKLWVTQDEYNNGYSTYSDAGRQGIYYGQQGPTNIKIWGHATSTLPDGVTEYTVNNQVVNGKFYVVPGTEVTVIATPATNHNLVSWTKNGTSLDGTPSTAAVSTTFAVNANTEVSATFAINTYTVKVGGIPTSPNPYGYAEIINCSHCQHVSYDENANVHKYTVNHGDDIMIEATAETGHHFAAWEGYDSDVNPLEIVGVDRDYTINAYFEVDTFAVSASGDHGTVALSGDGLTIDGHHGKYGGPVTFTAIPDEGYHFVKWNDNNTDNPRTITVTKDTTLTATFAIAYRLDSVRTTWTVEFDGVTRTVVSYGNAHPDNGYVMIPKNAQVVITPSTDDKPLVSKLELIIDPASIDPNTIPERINGDNWTFLMPADNRVLRTTWKQDAGLAYAKSDTTVYLGDSFSKQELTNPHGIPVTYSIVHKTGTNSGNTINNAGVVTINGAGIDTVKAIFAGNDTLLADTALYILHVHTYYTLTLTAIGNGSVEIQAINGNKSIIPSSSISVTECCSSYENEQCDSLFDGIITGGNKWCTVANPKFVEFRTTNAVQVNGYTLYTANDNSSNPGRNPKSWSLKANLDGSNNWTIIDSVANDATMQDVNYTPFDFEMDVPGTYRYFRFEVSEVHSGSDLQLGEMQLFYLGNTLPDGVTQGPTPDTYIVEYGTEVTVIATPDAGYALLNWEDNSMDATRTVTVTSDTNLVATFGFLTPGLTPEGELTTLGHSFVSETGEIIGVPRITETGEFTMVGREPTTIDLSTITEAFTAQNGDTLKGTLDVEHHPVKISIAKGATVTLDGVTINGTHSMSYLWAGITCKGDATIILKDGTTNKVTGFNNEYPGIYVPVGSTLTITGGTEGTDSLIVGSNGFAAGIGAGLNHKSCGNIIIQGGTIVATGDLYAAGIGGAYVSTCGDIEIRGGKITAKGGVGAAGIGGGRGANCGAIHISGGTIIAEGGEDAAGIGGGGPINTNTHCGSITITSTVTSVTAKKSAQNPGPYSIGAGKDGTCGTVTIGGSPTGPISESPYTYPQP